MAASSRAVPEEGSLERVIAAAMRELERLGYSRRSRNRYRAVWAHLAQFASREELGGLFSEDLSARFEAASGIGLGQGGKPGQEWRRHVAHGMKLLTDYARHGRIGRVRTNVKDCQVSPAMEAILAQLPQQ